MNKSKNQILKKIAIGTTCCSVLLINNFNASEISSELSEITSETIEVSSEVNTTSEVNSTINSEATSELTDEYSESVQEIDISNVTLNTIMLPAKQSASELSGYSDEKEGTSGYINNERVSADAGLSQLQITPKSKSVNVDNKEVFYVLDESGNIVSGSTKEPRSYDGNLITVYNGAIVEADSAIVSTVGGYDYSFYMYPSIDDLKANTNGVSMNGGGFNGQYIETIEEDGEYYYHILISGFDGYVKSTDMQIIPEELIQSESHYEVKDGELIYYSAIDSLEENSYEEIVMGEASPEMQEGVTYYSNDDVNYYTSPIITPDMQASVSYNNYFMNLPFRSESSYTATDYKNYLKAKGKTSSEYYNETTAFTKAQELENVNSLMMFSMANHESAYGTSSYAQACYNFFGRGAIDSDPDQACESYSYPTATDGILAQALFLENGYWDVLDWRYSGTHVGNKAGGMNVKYASDPDWGKKISNHAYMMDQYMGGKEEDKYSILQVTGVKHVYTSSNLTTDVKSSGDSESLGFYDLSPMAGTNNAINVVATGKSGSSYEIQVPTAVKQDSSSTCSYTNSMSGSYPNYGNRSNVSVNTNTANYSCDYESYSAQQYWISNSNTKIIAGDTSIPDVSNTSHKYQYYPNGNVKFDFTIKGNYIYNAVGYDENGKKISVYEYYPNTKYGDHGSHIKYKFYLDSNQNIIKANGYEDKTHDLISLYTYLGGTKYGSHGKRIEYVFHFDNNEYLTYADKRNTSGQTTYKYVYYPNTKYGNHGNHIKYRFKFNTSNNTVNSAYRYNDNTHEQTYYYTYYSGAKYGSHGDRIRYRFKLKAGTDTITSAYRYVDHTKNIDRTYQYYDGAKLSNDYGQKRKYVFYLDPNTDMEINYAYKYSTSTPQEAIYKYYYKDGTSYHDNYGDRITSKVKL